MISYNHKAINDIFSSIAEIIRANISVYDDNFEGANLQNLVNRSICHFFTGVLQKKCSICDMKALSRAAKEGKPFYYQCHFGHYEMMIPHQLDNQTNIYVLIGPFRDVHSELETVDKIKELCRQTNQDEEQVLKVYFAMPLFSEELFHPMVRMVQVIIDYIQQSNLIAIKEDFIANQLNPYLEANLAKNILISDLAPHFYYTNKQLEYEINKQTGMSPKRYVMFYKINAAKRLLRNTELPLTSISSAVGYDNYNYFIKVFKSFTKETPLQYRKKHALKPFEKPGD